jgi:hypothetical protein
MMNERIKELAEQAEKYADDNFKGQPTYSEAYDSKFAELIVRECIAKCDDLNSMKYIADHFEIKIEGLNDE